MGTRTVSRSRNGRATPSKHSTRRRRGSTTVEFAVFLPILMTLALLTIDFGRFAYAFIAVNNAAREGASQGAFSIVTPASKPLWDTAIRQAIENELFSDQTANDSLFDNPADLIVVEPEVIDEGAGKRYVRVDVTYPFNTLINWPFLPGYNDPINLRRVAVMRMVR